MSDYIRSKSFSHNRLNVTVNFFLPQSSPYFLFKTSNTDTPQQLGNKTITKLRSEHSQGAQTQLQVFKSRLIRGIQNFKDRQKGSNFEQTSIFRNVKLNQMLIEDELRQSGGTHFAQGGVFVKQKLASQTQAVNRYYRVYNKTNKHNKTQVGYGDRSQKQQEEQSKQPKSIMIMRKMHEMKEKIVLDKKHKFQEQFYQVKETPIHHSQLFNLKKTSKRKVQEKDSSLRNKKAITDIIRLRQAMRKNSQQQLSKSTGKEPFQVVVKGKSKFGQNICFKRNSQSLKMSVEEYKAQKRKVKQRKNSLEKGNSVKNGEEIGPWARRRNSEIEFQF